MTATSAATTADRTASPILAATGVTMQFGGSTA
jgi:hypothetical protein